MKISDKLYNINAKISLWHIGLKKPVEYDDICNINKALAEIIKEIRELEK